MISVMAAACSQRLVLHISAELQIKHKPRTDPREGEHRDYLLKKKKRTEKNCEKVNLHNPQAPQPLWGIRHGQNDSSEINQSCLPATLCCIGMSKVRNHTVHLLLSVVFYWPFLLLNQLKHHIHNPHRLWCTFEITFHLCGYSLCLYYTSDNHHTCVVMQSHDSKE